MSMLVTSNEAEKLCLFNKFIDKIIRTGFIDELKNNKLGTSINFEFNPDGTGTISTESRLHDETKLTAVLTTLRLFLQKNDDLSLERISTLYKQMRIDSSYKNTFANIMTALNNGLDKKAFTFLTDAPTYRKVLDVILYSDIAHTNQRDILRQWTSNGHNENMVRAEFERIVEFCIYCIVPIKKLNEEILEKYSS